MQSLFGWFLVIQAALGAVLAPRNTTIACNNSPDLCSRAYSNITQLGAHDSPFLNNASASNSISFSDAGNQNVNSVAQLTAGVRLLTAQVHNNNGAWHLCHTSCSLLDAGTLSAWLTTIKTWMDGNPNDVVTILLVNSDDATAEDLNAEFEAANITSYGYQPPSTTTALATWPTLQEMISNNTRLVTFVADLDPSANTVAPYLLDEFTFVFENPYNVTSLSNFSCVADRPPAVFEQTATAISSGRLPLVNHFLDTNEGFGIDIPDTANITTTNGNSGVGSLGAAASECSAAYGKAPAFLLVDFFDEGSAISVVNSLNGISTTAVGQTKPSVTTTSTSGASSLSILALDSYCWLGALFVAWLAHQM
ncbi:MAG: hypothetical protein ASARMPRED_003346 [Alectoria sarmentosa]|nr:MAG: hypothetical protein ASARMPRED_003346 [Alectoria sarmentosa]